MKQLAAVFVVIALLGACGGDPEPGEAAFDQANGRLTNNNKQFAFGNGPVATELAQKFNERMRLMLKVGFKNRASNSSVDDDIITYVNLTDDSAAFLIYIPGLRSYKEDAQGTLLDVAWPLARGRVKELEPQVDRKLAIGLRGTLLYGASAFGSSGMDEPDEKKHSGAILNESFYPFFTGGYPPEVAFKSEAVPVETAAEATPAPAAPAPPARTAETVIAPADLGDRVISRVVLLETNPPTTAIVVSTDLLATSGPLTPGTLRIRPLRGPAIEVAPVPGGTMGDIVLLRPLRPVQFDPLPRAAEIAPPPGTPLKTYFAEPQGDAVGIQAFTSNVTSVDEAIHTDQRLTVIPMGAALIDGQGRLVGIGTSSANVYATAGDIQQAIARAAKVTK